MLVHSVDMVFDLIAPVAVRINDKRHPQDAKRSEEIKNKSHAEIL